MADHRSQLARQEEVEKARKIWQHHLQRLVEFSGTAWSIRDQLPLEPPRLYLRKVAAAKQAQYPWSNPLLRRIR